MYLRVRSLMNSMSQTSLYTDNDHLWLHTFSHTQISFASNHENLITPVGSTPSKIGWNIPPNSNTKATGTSSNAKPSAPVSEHASKTSATNVQSGYPSGNPPPYSPSGISFYLSHVT